jgi:hypothetical protein
MAAENFGSSMHHTSLIGHICVMYDTHIHSRHTRRSGFCTLSYFIDMRIAIILSHISPRTSHSNAAYLASHAPYLERELSSKAHAISSERTVVVKSSIYLEDDIVCRVFVTQALQGPFRSPHGFPSSRSLRETRQCIIIDPQERKASEEHVMSQNHQYYGPSGIHPFLEPVCKCKC